MGFLSDVGQFVENVNGSQSVAAELAKRLRDLADAIEHRVEIVQSAADTMAYDFITSRMPPRDNSIPLQGTLWFAAIGISRSFVF